MTGIYFHIPFCKKACHYCNFHFSTTLDLKQQVVEALHKEIALLNEDLIGGKKKGKEDVSTIYFGGGTPSILEPEEIKALIYDIRKYYHVSNDAEITLEANPDDITKLKLEAWKSAGINRLSIGIQSLNDRDLQWMNRIHTAQEGLNAITLIQEAGFWNYSIDLIFGTPGSNTEEWKDDIEKVIALNAPHIACYALTVEPSTALFKMIQLHKKENIDQEKQATQFLYLMEAMINAGYEHYEISNFAKPGFRSKHNSSYWKGEKYIGIGPSAHSFDSEVRRWNISNNALYITSISKGTIPYEEESLSRKDKFNEFVMIRLRTIEGLNLMEAEQKFGRPMVEQIIRGINKYITEGKAIMKNEILTLTNEGKLFADGIASDLFVS